MLYLGKKEEQTKKELGNKLRGSVGKVIFYHQMVWVTRNGTKMQIPRKLSHHIPSMPIWSTDAFQEKVPQFCSKWLVQGVVLLYCNSQERQKFDDIESEDFQLYKRAVEEEYQLQVAFMIN